MALANDLNWSKVDAMSVACDKEFHKTTVWKITVLEIICSSVEKLVL
jgi:hypothetical protein